MSILKMLDSCKKVKDITKPLMTSTRIIDVSYVEIDKDGNFYIFQPEWELFEKKVKIPGYIDKLPSLLLEEIPNPGFTSEGESTVTDYHNESWKNLVHFNHEKGYDLGMILAERNEHEVYRKLTFYADNFDNESERAQFYLNNSKMLKSYFNYFSNEIQDLKKVITPESIHDSENFYRFYSALQKDYKGFNIEIPQLLLELEKSRGLTKREKQVIYWYLVGKSSAETGVLLSISENTVEAHFYNIKSKLNISKKSQICFELMKKNPFFKPDIIV